MHPKQLPFLETEIEELHSLKFWIISDSHFRHANIIKYCNRPYHHNTLMENNWWETVGLEDTILHLGDVAMSKGIMELKEEHFIKNLPGKKYLILGNHDTPKNITDKNKFYKQVGFDVVNEFKISGYVSPTTKKEWKLYFVHRPGGEIKPFDDLRIVESDPKAIVLHGHIHNKSIDHPRLVNLSVEMTDYRPVWLPTVLEERLSKLETGK